MTRSEPRTATAAIAVTLGVGTLSKQLGLAPLPPGLVQLFGPVAEAALRFTSESVRRGVFVLLILLCPMWGAAALTAHDSVPALEQAIELPLAVFAILAPAVAILWRVHDQGACVALTATRRTRDVRRDGQVRWSALACTHLKRGRGARVARLVSRPARSFPLRRQSKPRLSLGHQLRSPARHLLCRGTSHALRAP